jgi:hypothetical protein
MRRIRLIDGAALVTLLLALGLLGMGGAEGRWPVPLVAVLATVYAAYKLIRIVIELRSGVSVGAGLGEADYDRIGRPVAFWWAMGVEAACLLLGSGVAVWLWVRLASA